MKITDPEIIEAMEFIKSQHNGEMPYKFSAFECAKMMGKYLTEKSSSLEDLEHLISWNLTKNHTDRYGVIKGRHSATYSYMNEDKEEVLKWLKDNYRQK